MSKGWQELVFVKTYFQIATESSLIPRNSIVILNVVLPDFCLPQRQRFERSHCDDKHQV